MAVCKNQEQTPPPETEKTDVAFRCMSTSTRNGKKQVPPKPYWKRHLHFDHRLDCGESEDRSAGLSYWKTPRAGLSPTEFWFSHCYIHFNSSINSRSRASFPPMSHHTVSYQNPFPSKVIAKSNPFLSPPLQFPTCFSLRT